VGQRSPDRRDAVNAESLVGPRTDLGEDGCRFSSVVFIKQWDDGRSDGMSGRS